MKFFIFILSIFIFTSCSTLIDAKKTTKKTMDEGASKLLQKVGLKKEGTLVEIKNTKSSNLIKTQNLDVEVYGLAFYKNDMYFTNNDGDIFQKIGDKHYPLSYFDYEVGLIAIHNGILYAQTGTKLVAFTLFSKKVLYEINVDGLTHGFAVDNKNIYIGYLGGKIEVYDRKNVKKKPKTFQAKNEDPTFMLAYNGKVLVPIDGEMLEVIDTIENDKENISLENYALSFDIEDGKLYAFKRDGVDIYDLKDYSFIKSSYLSIGSISKAKINDSYLYVLDDSELKTFKIGKEKRPFKKVASLTTAKS